MSSDDESDRISKETDAEAKKIRTWERRTKSGRLASEIAREELEHYFHIPVDVAAQQMGVGLTKLKSICRAYEIQRWPYRRVRRLQFLAQRINVGMGSAQDHHDIKQLMTELDLPPTSPLWENLQIDYNFLVAQLKHYEAQPDGPPLPPPQPVAPPPTILSYLAKAGGLPPLPNSALNALASIPASSSPSIPSSSTAIPSPVLNALAPAAVQDYLAGCLRKPSEEYKSLDAGPRARSSSTSSPSFGPFAGKSGNAAPGLRELQAYLGYQKRPADRVEEPARDAGSQVSELLAALGIKDLQALQDLLALHRAAQEKEALAAKSGWDTFRSSSLAAAGTYDARPASGGVQDLQRIAALLMDMQAAPVEASQLGGQSNYLTSLLDLQALLQPQASYRTAPPPSSANVSRGSILSLLASMQHAGETAAPPVRQPEGPSQDIVGQFLTKVLAGYLGSQGA